MSTSGFHRSLAGKSLVRFLVAFAAVVGLALTPNPAFAQHSGGSGGHASGGGTGHAGGGGGGFHGGSGGAFHGGGGSYGGTRSSGGGSYDRGGAFRGGSHGGAARGTTGRNGVPGTGRDSGSPASHSSNIRPAINDGQWHSFGNSSSARSGEGRNSGDMANANLSARSIAGNRGSSEGGWRSFGSSSGTLSRGTPGFVGGASRAPGFGRGGGWRGGWGGYGWGGGFGRGGWGGWGFGIGWPYWGPFWAFGWDPYWYNPYGYGPWPAYSYYPDYSYDWRDDPPPYRPPDSNDSPGSHVSAPDSNLSPNYHLSSGSNPASDYDDQHFDETSDLNLSDSSAVENGQTPQPEVVPAPVAQP